MQNRSLNVVVPLLLFLFIALIVVYLPGFPMDTRGGFMTWAWYINDNGLANAYGSDTNYMPVYQYVLWFFARLSGSDKAIADNLPYLRCITLLFDFAGLWYVFRWIDKKTDYFVVVIISVLNVAYSYDTVIWGQVDGILSAFIFVALFYAWKGNNIYSTIWLVLAFNFKLQAIVILPLWGLLFVYNIITARGLKTTVFPVVAGIAVQIALVIPFMTGKSGIGKIGSIIPGSFNIYNYVSIFAANFWQYLGPGRALIIHDSEKWIMSVTYKQAGLFLFFTTSFLALLPIALLVFKRWKSKNEKIQLSRELIWTVGAMLYLLFYIFNTEMHERYCQPAFIFITAYAFFTGDFLAYVLFSIMYFLTLEHENQSLKLHNYDTLIFDLRFLASINAVIIVYLARKIYKGYKLALDN